MDPKQDVSESTLRRWARAAFEPFSPINPDWHPTIVNECGAINAQALLDGLTDVEERFFGQYLEKDPLEGLAEYLAQDDQDVAPVKEEPVFELPQSRRKTSGVFQRHTVSVQWDDDESEAITLDLTPTLRACRQSGVTPILSKVAQDEAMSVYLKAYDTGTD